MLGVDANSATVVGRSDHLDMYINVRADSFRGNSSYMYK